MIIILCLLTLLSLFMVNKVTLFSVLICLTFLLTFIIKYKKNSFINKKLETILLSLGLITSILWIISKIYVFYIIQSVLALIITVYYSIFTIQRLNSKIKKASIGAILSIYVITTVFLLAVAINPNVLISPLQKSNGAINSFEASSQSKQTVLENGATYINDISYGTQYPNSYLDVYLSPKEGTNKPTLFYIHGGGYVWGDKLLGDPNAENLGVTWYFNKYLEAGYNVVSVNYAFAPEYLYPTAVIQLNESLQFLKESGDKYGISMNQVVIAGTSAGGNMAGMLGLICSNSTIASQLKVNQHLTTDEVKAVVFMSALINNEYFSVTHSSVIDYVFLQCGRVAMNTNDLYKSKIAASTNIINLVNENYPPCYISDGNSGTFYSQAVAFHEKLAELNVNNMLNTYSKDTEILSHGFETDNNSKSAEDNLNKTIGYLNTIINN